MRSFSVQLNEEHLHNCWIMQIKTQQWGVTHKFKMSRYVTTLNYYSNLM